MGSRATEARKTPEQKEAEQAKKEELKVARLKEAQALGRAFATDDGRRALRQIMERCCYQSAVTYMNNDGVHLDSTEHNAALHGFYIWLRKHVDRDTLIAVEIDNQNKEKEKEHE